MPDYFVFGGCLRSELVFPELTETGGRAPDWRLKVGKLVPEEGGEIISSASLSRSCHVSVTRSKEAFRYTHSCTGTFEVSENRRTITFEPVSGGDLNTARTDLVSRVLLSCVSTRDVTWLHGSAVRIGDSAVAFLGPSGAGKSTIALALDRAGARHICDDTLPVETAPNPVVYPSDRVIRLRPDSRRYLASHASAIRRETDGKFVLTQDAIRPNRITSVHESETARTPLGALYLLTTVPALEPPRPADGHARRLLLSPRLAVPALMQHIKLGPVIRAEDPAFYMQQLGLIARSVPVYELRLPRDWAAVDDVVAEILAWHGGPEADRVAATSASVSA